MKDFRPIWKALADSKTIRSQDMLTLCVLRALISKSNDKEEVARYYTSRAYSANKRGPYYDRFKAVAGAARQIGSTIRFKEELLGVDMAEIFESVDEKDLFLSVLDNIVNFDFDRMYSYIFVRQDLPQEDQAVQAAHATMVVGQKMPKTVDARFVHFVLIGVPGRNELSAAFATLQGSGFANEWFSEKDIGTTAVASHPIHWTKRGVLKEYEILTFETEVEILS